MLPAYRTEGEAFSIPKFELTPQDVDGFLDELRAFHHHFRTCFARSEPREHFFNKYPPAEPEVLRLLAPRRGLTAIEKSKSTTERTTNCIIPELSNFGSPPAEPGVYLD